MLPALLVLSACDSPPPEPAGEVMGRQYVAPQVGAIAFPSGWRLVHDPAEFRGGREGTLVEARRGDLVAILTWTPLSPPLDSAHALELLPLLQPVDEQAADYRYGRIPSCPHAVQRSVGAWTHTAWTTPTGLAVWNSFGDDPGPVRDLVCEHTR